VQVLAVLVLEAAARLPYWIPALLPVPFLACLYLQAAPIGC